MKIVQDIQLRILAKKLVNREIEIRKRHDRDYQAQKEFYERELVAINSRIIRINEFHAEEIKTIRSQEQRKYEKIIAERDSEISRLNGKISKKRRVYSDMKELALSMENLSSDVDFKYDRALKMFEEAFGLIKSANMAVTFFNKNIEKRDEKQLRVLSER